MTRRGSITTPKKQPIRCAIYTRKSSEEGLQQEFNSLDAQREAAEAYIASQKAEGLVAIPQRYDDGGYTGGNMERPALRRLLSDIDEGKVDCVVVYKVDRLSRSLLDFARIMETFDRRNVSFVSVTQHFNTTHSMGRLTLNILLSFAQFEREIIGERIRDKIAASRQKGKWTGGTPILGYDVERSNGGPRLVVNHLEAPRVRDIFELYLERGALLATVAEIERRGWRSKVWMTSGGRRRGGELIDKCRLHKLLTNVLYVGKVRHKKNVYAGEHEAIITDDLFQRVQARLLQNRNAGNAELRNRHGALLRGLLYCKACGRVMSHTFTSRGNKRYRYYTCMNVIKHGRRKCRTASLPAGETERAVVEQIACIGRDQSLLEETHRQSCAQTKEAIARLEDERHRLKRSLAGYRADGNRATKGSVVATAMCTVDLDDRILQAEHRMSEIDRQLVELRSGLLSIADVTAAFTDFGGVWKALSPREQVRIMNLLVRRVEFDGADSTIAITFHSTGIKTLIDAANDGETPPSELMGSPGESNPASSESTPPAIDDTRGNSAARRSSRAREVAA